MSYVSRGTKIDTEKCVENIGNRFQLIIIAAARARELSQQNRHSDRHEHLHTPVTALLEVQSGELTIGDIRRVR
jgi:DNA-directed RNA polymerase omega subunit